MRNETKHFLVAVALLTTVTPAFAAKRSVADKAWIETCIQQRQASREKPAALRRYCVCMQAVVEDNRAFEITELERTYPPAHQVCWKQAGRRAPRP
jgi:hypothetical protein